MTIGLKDLVSPQNHTLWFFQKMFNRKRSTDYYHLFSYEVDIPAFEQIAKEEDVDILVEDTHPGYVVVTILEKTDSVGKVIYKKNR